MAYEPHLVTPFEKSGLKKWYKPFLIGQKAFPVIENAYARRGVVRKREGYQLLGSLPAADKPVQGLKNWINPATLGERLLAFSLTKSYLFDDGTQTFNDVTFRFGGGAFSFTNGANDYFWASNFAGSMWVTNNLTADGINYWNLANNWTNFRPIVSGTTVLNAALIILPYKGRLVVLNTIEDTAPFSNRARWSQLGTPYVLSDGTHAPAPGFGVDATAWRSDIVGKGGFIDADTSERIVSAEIIKDTLIVAFQRSTWRLRYTGNEILPFIWERLNTQYGAESTYSNIAFDEAALFFSRYGWIGSTTNDVARIDLDIPDDSFAIEGTNVNITGLNKVQGIRDFFRNFAYWTYIPIGSAVATQIYAYNYIDKSWHIFDPSVPINVFGTYRNTAGDFTWSVFTKPTDTWDNFGVTTIWSDLGSGQNEDFPYIIGGDLNGNVYLMFEFFNAPATDNGTNFNFNILTSRFNPYFDQGAKCRLGYVDLYCTSFPGGEITINHFVDDQQTPVFTRKLELFSRGVIVISNITPGNPTIITTATQHFLSPNEQTTISDIVGNIANILNNNTYPVTVIDTFNLSIPVNTTGYSYNSAGFVYNKSDQDGDATYTRIFLGAVAHMHQLQITLSDDQLADPAKGTAQFEMQGLVWWTRKMGRIRG
jgi:hypothetical protein